MSREKLVIFCTKQAYTERADECKANRGAKTTDRRRDNSVIYSGSKVLRREARNRSNPRAEKEKKKKKKRRRKKKDRKDERSRQNYIFNTRSISNSPVALAWRSCVFFSFFFFFLGGGGIFFSPDVVP